MFYSERYNFLYIEAKQYPQNGTSQSKVSAKSLLICSCLATALTALIASYHAQADQPEQNARWSGEASVGSDFTSGNTDTFDLSADVNLKRKIGLWMLEPRAESEFSRTGNTETRNRQEFSLVAGRSIHDRLDLSISADYTLDRFSGYNYRSFLGLGLTYDVIDQNKLTFILGGRPGIHFDRTTDQIVADMTVSGTATNTLAAQLTGVLTWRLSETLTITWNGKADYIATTPENTTLESDLAAKIGLIGPFNAKILLNHRYITAPPRNRENLDTRLSFALVYKFD